MDFGRKMIPIYKPYLPSNSLKYAHEAIDSTWISSSGRYLEKATELLADYLGTKYVQLVNNGTSATHLVSKAVSFKDPNINKIILPNNVYVAAWNSFLYDKEHELILKEPSLSTWNIDLENDIPLDETTAVCFVHNLGNIINVPKFMRENPGVVCIEDNCEGLSGEYEGHKSGTKSLASSLSFFGNKTITSGEGGAVVVADEDTYEYLKCIQGQGQSKERYVHSYLGYNYRMTNIQAAILTGQLEIISEILEMKSGLFNFYRDGLSSVDGVSLQSQEEGTTHSNWMFSVRIHGSSGYEESSRFLSERGIETRPMFYPSSRHDHIRESSLVTKGTETNSEILNRECIMLPSFPELKKKELTHIVESIKSLATKVQSQR